MKRIFVVALAVIMALSAFTASATSQGDHNHKWVEVDPIYDATCTETGLTYDQCTVCGEVRRRVIPAKGHYFPNPWKTIIEPTCTETGVEMNTCVRVNNGDPCGFEWWRELPALGHDWGDWYVAKAPTQTEDGYEERACARCGITEQRPLKYEDYGATASLQLSVSFDNEKIYKADETVSFSCTVTNTGSVSLWIEQVLMDFAHDEDKLVGTPVDATLEHGNSIDVTVQYTATQDDEDRGFENVRLFARGKESDKPDMENYVVSNIVPAVINLGGVNGSSFIVEKTELSKPANGVYYTVGEKVVFSIEIWNLMDYPVYNVSVRELPNGNAEAWISLDYIPVLEANGHRSYRYTMTVLEEDVVNSPVINIAAAY